jgi:hypothetical protein
MNKGQVVEEPEVAQTAQRVTRSGRAFTVSTTPQNPWQAVLKLLIPLIIFVGHRTMMFSTTSMDLNQDTLYPTAPEVVIEPLLQPLRTLDAAKLDYVNACDEWVEGKDIRWTPVAVHAHEYRVKAWYDKDKKKIVKEKHLCLEVEMADGENHWVAEEALRLESPRVIAQYVIDRKLYNHPSFSWVKKHFNWDKRGIRKLCMYSAVSQKDQNVQVRGTSTKQSQARIGAGQTQWGQRLGRVDTNGVRPDQWIPDFPGLGRT